MRRIGVVLALIVLVVVGILILGKVEHSGPSVLNRGSRGWMAARRFLEYQGVEVLVADRPWDQVLSVEEIPQARSSIVVTAFPWVDKAGDRELDELRRFVQRGGTGVIAYTGGLLSGEEKKLLERFNLYFEKARDRAGLSPLTWRQFAREEWRAAPNRQASRGDSGAVTTLRPFVMRALDQLPAPHDPESVLYRQPSGSLPLVSVNKVGAGRLVLLPAEALSNGRLSNVGNSDLLATLSATLNGRWILDEYHQGLRAVDVTQEDGAGLAIDLFAAHLVVLYVLSLFALARRFGEPWQEIEVQSGSTASFLRGLGAMHHRLGHHAEGAELLLERVEALEPGLHIPEGLKERASQADAEELRRIATEMGRLRRNRKGAGL